MNDIQEQYRGLLSSLVYGGKPKKDRTGVGTRSVFGRILRHNMAKGFPLLTTKKIYFEHAITELLWILNGRSDMEYLRSNGVSYWDADYNRSGRTDGTLGPVYGVQWRNFNGVDQIRKLIRDIKKDPSSRRLIVNAWNAADIDDMALPPCHYGFQIYINDGKIDLMWNQRSADVFLGLPYDFAIYGLLLVMLAKGTDYKPGELIASLGDCHLYNNHIDQAKEQLSRDFRELPFVSVDWGLDVVEGAGGHLRIPTKDMVNISDYNPHPPIKAELNVGI